ncbi:GNAT family N-acetyltransferase [Nonomuraea longispora]|uniref:GNAT family N-acetyltransferase n=1 Tax=Nonomuraea longispora TaxID=1848320 RepID=UPI0015F2B2FE|nr:hypothetical protein [Nonomuraea longispora]
MRRFTTRLRLEPAGPSLASDLWTVHDDEEVWPWYGTARPDLRQPERWAASMGESWLLHGVRKWIAYDRMSGEVVGRGVVHGPPQRAFPCGDGAHRHAVRGRDPYARPGRRRRGERDDAPFAVCVRLRKDRGLVSRGAEESATSSAPRAGHPA